MPEVTFDRLNEHYREVVALARLVLRHSPFETDRGDVRAPGFLIDMNRVFQDFVTQVLREELQVSERTFRSDHRVSGLYLDDAQCVPLKPDLSWRDGATCTFVGDAKYKRITHAGKLLEIAALDLSGTIDDLLERIGALAQRVRALRAELPEKRAA